MQGQGQPSSFFISQQDTSESKFLFRGRSRRPRFNGSAIVDQLINLQQKNHFNLIIYLNTIAQTVIRLRYFITLGRKLIIGISVSFRQDVSPQSILQGKWNINIQNYNPIIDRMSKKQMTLVYYHVPEDKDDPDCPNVFGVPYNKNTLKLTHIYESFPLKGTYLFRFKYSCEGQVVWLDLPDIQAKLPTFKDKVYVKATRVSWNDSKLHSHYREKQSHVQLQTNSTQPHQIDFFENSTPPPKKEQTKITTNIQNNRVDYVKEKPQTMPKIHSNLLEEVHPPQNGSSTNNNNSLGMDFLAGMSSPLPSAQKKPEINLMHGFEKQNHGDLI